MIVLVGGEKGGTGKTTDATNLAAMRAASGRDVLLVDTDPQGSASLWAQIREESDQLPRVASVQKFGRGLTREIKDLATRYQDIVVDAGGRDSVELRGGLAAADIAVFPLQASQFDLWTVERLADLVETAREFNPGLRALAVISRASTSASNTDADLARDLIGDYPALELATSIIRDRVAFRRAAGNGQSVKEYGTDEKAVLEIEQLYKEVFHGR